MTTLRLSVYCRYYDNKKVYFTANDEETIEKLARHGVEPEFAAHVRLPESCASSVGTNVRILVRLKKLSFISQYPFNRGERVEFTRLDLIEI